MSDQESAEQTGSGVPAPGSLSDLVREFFGFVSVRGKQEVGRIQERSRYQLELRQLRRDKDKRMEKLGREAMALVDAGEVAHPGLAVHIRHIRDLEGRIDTLVEEGPTAHGVPLDATEE